MTKLLSLCVCALIIGACNGPVSSPTRTDALSKAQTDTAPLAFAVAFEGTFTSTEKKRVITWLKTVAGGTTQLFGAYPFTVDVIIKRSSGYGQGPVPWAYTQRSSRQCVIFHVDLSYSLTDFLNDWTAPHEFSHLAIPFVGKRNAWFSEGFASYFQYFVMVEMGVLSATEAQHRLAAKWEQYLPLYSNEISSFPQRAMELRSQHNYPAMYWGGAYYFDRLDSGYHHQGSSLKTVIQTYQRLRADTGLTGPDDLLREWQVICDEL